MHSSVPVQTAFGNYIRELRERTGLTVDQLAEKSGFSSHRLSAIERGEVNLSVSMLLILAMSLDTTLQELFSGIAGRMGISQPFQIEPRQLWIGLVEVRPLAGCEVLDAGQGAFVEIVTWAGGGYEYGLKVGSVLGELHLFALSIADAEPVENRRNRQGFLEESLEETIFQAENNSQATICGPFHTYAKADA